MHLQPTISTYDLPHIEMQRISIQYFGCIAGHLGALRCSSKSYFQVILAVKKSQIHLNSTFQYIKIENKCKCPALMSWCDIEKIPIC